MKHLPATLPLYGLALLTIFSRASTNFQTELKLVKISKTSTTPDAMVQYEFTLQSDTKISNIYCIVLNVMQGSQETNYENSNVSQIELSSNVTIPYQVAMDEFKTGEKVTLIMTVHNATQHTLAYLVQDWTPQDINPELAWVGQNNNSLDHKPSLRVKTGTDDITIDDNPCKTDSSPCYFLHYQVEAHLEICTVAKDGNKDVPGFYQCDETLTVFDSPDISPVSGIILTHKQDGHFDLETHATYRENSATMDILIYEMDQSYLTITDCTIQNSSQCVGDLLDELPDKAVRILLVALGDDRIVTESTELEFVDYKTETQLLTKNIVEVRWNSAENHSYKITLDDNNEDIAEVSLTCGNEDNAKCKAYFLDLEETKNYKASVTQEQADVSFTVAAETNPDEKGTHHMTIKKFTEQTTTEFIVTLSSSSTIKLSTLYMAIINTQASNPQETIEFITDEGEISSTERDFTFNIDESLLAQKENLALVITAHGEGEKDPALGVARVDPAFEYIEPPTINEVGTDSILWIRVRTTTLFMTVNGNECPKNTSTYFKKDNDFIEPLNLCRPAGKNLDEQDMEQCKIGGEITQLPDPISMKTIELMYPETGNPSLNFSGEFTKSETQLEASWYDGTENVVSTCDIIFPEGNLGDCIIDSDHLTGDKYTFLIVSLTKNNVMASTAVEFEDYKTKATSVIEDIIQVKWLAKDYNTYDVFLEPKLDTSYDSVHVDCGADQDDKCLAFFIDLLSNTTYTVRVKKQKDGDLNIVGNNITTPIFP